MAHAVDELGGACAGSAHRRCALLGVVAAARTGLDLQSSSHLRARWQRAGAGRVASRALSRGLARVEFSAVRQMAPVRPETTLTMAHWRRARRVRRQRARSLRSLAACSPAQAYARGRIRTRPGESTVNEREHLVTVVHAPPQPPVPPSETTGRRPADEQDAFRDLPSGRTSSRVLSTVTRTRDLAVGPAQHFAIAIRRLAPRLLDIMTVCPKPPDDRASTPSSASSFTRGLGTGYATSARSASAPKRTAASTPSRVSRGGRRGLLDGFTGAEFLEHLLHRHSRAFDDGLAHHHVGVDRIP